MTPGVFYCYDDQDIDEAASEMASREVRRMIILDRKNKLAGIVSLGRRLESSGRGARCRKYAQTYRAGSAGESCVKPTCRFRGLYRLGAPGTPACPCARIDRRS